MIEAHMGGNWESRDVDDGWEDEQAGEGDGDWTPTPIRIKALFHSRMKHPGQEEFEAGKLHHHSLVSIIHNKVS